MKIFDVITKSVKEQYRSFWILVLTVFMAPFFVGVYYLISESSNPSYDILIYNRDKGVTLNNRVINYGKDFISAAKSEILNPGEIPLNLLELTNPDSASILLKNRKADVLLIIPEGFSDSIDLGLRQHRPIPPEIEFQGDMTDFSYMISAIWGSELFRVYIENVSGFPSPFRIKESHIARDSGQNEFDLYMPGLFILSLVMLMFSASIAFVTEIENGTILRFRLSGLTTFEFISGVTIIQLAIGLLSIGITMGTAYLLGFRSNGPFWPATLVIGFSALSIIAFSVILAALTKSSNEILVVGNFPLFLFMFFTGAAFPLEGKALFSIGGYGLNLQGLMSPTHAVLALKKVMIFNSGFTEIIPELSSLFILTIIYFAIGSWLFKKKHMRIVGL